MIDFSIYHCVERHYYLLYHLVAYRVIVIQSDIPNLYIISNQMSTSIYVLHRLLVITHTGCCRKTRLLSPQLMPMNIYSVYFSKYVTHRLIINMCSPL